jgi:hypothetical protein
LTKGSSEIFAKKLIGNTYWEDALKRIENLTNDEARMATAEAQRARHAAGEQARAVDDRVASVDGKIAEVVYGAQILIGQAQHCLI